MTKPMIYYPYFRTDGGSDAYYLHTDDTQDLKNCSETVHNSVEIRICSSAKPGRTGTSIYHWRKVRGDEPVAMILGDSTSMDTDLKTISAASKTKGATVFGYYRRS